MKRACFFAVLLVLVLIVTAVTVQANEPVVISPYHLADGEVVSVSAEDEVVIQARWVACTHGLTRAFRNAAVISLEETFDGQSTTLVDSPGHRYWTSPTPFDRDVSEYCRMQTRGGWVTYWHFELGTLAPGQHEIHFTWTLSHPIPDGGDFNGDGKLDHFSGDDLNHDNSFVIEVS